MAEKIYEFLNRYSAGDIYPFHMPGHKGNKDFLNLDYLNYDITEIDGADNLHNAQGIIKEAMNRAARAYGAQRSFFLVNGSTVGIQAAIMSVCADGDEILLARNSHRSAYGGLVLSGAKPVYICPEITGSSITEGNSPHIAGGISPSIIDEALKANPKIKAVFITSPTYEGLCSDISAISHIVHNHDKILIVDEAHGGHFGFNKYFPQSAVTLGADYVIQSLHKTLPALTQCSLLHINGPRANADLTAEILACLQTSSPSYIFMASIEKCVEMLENKGSDIFEPYINMLEGFRKSLASCSVIRLLGREMVGNHHIADIDLGKLVIFLNTTQMTGVEFGLIAREKYGVQLEMSGLNYALAITGIADKLYGMERLARAVLETDRELKSSQGNRTAQQFHYLRDCPRSLLTPREALRSSIQRSKRKVKLSEAEGLTAADFIIPYPPGIPAATPGEVLTENVIISVLGLLRNGIPVIGVNNENINILS